MNYKNLIILSICFCNLSLCRSQLLEGLYCGKQNCYDVLGITRETTKPEIARAYRQLAKKFHPDLHRGDEAKKTAETKFKEIATAYEILRDEETRTDYDYMLDNPEAYYAHYYRYYRRRVAPKVDVRIVLIVTISVISIIQYYSAWQRYESAIKYFMTVPKYRNKAVEIASTQQQTQENGKLNATDRTRKKKMSKAEQKEELEKLIRTIIEDNLDIKGAYAKPTIVDILWIQLIIFPWTLVMYLKWYFGWIWTYNIRKKPYGREEKLYLIRKNMQLGQNQFNAIEEDKIETFLQRELWIKDNCKQWKIEQEEEMKKNLADNPRYKQYRRYMKNHGPGRMTFED